MAKSLKLQILETTSALMTAAFGLVAALAWNQAIQAVIAEYISPDSQTLSMVIYAVVITIIAVICIVIIARTLGKLRDKVAEEEAAKEQK
jgi:TRAP-type C4-dicarboxylate transport system permease small subunit